MIHIALTDALGLAAAMAAFIGFCATMVNDHERIARRLVQRATALGMTDTADQVAATARQVRHASYGAAAVLAIVMVAAWLHVHWWRA